MILNGHYVPGQTFNLRTIQSYEPGRVTMGSILIFWGGLVENPRTWQDITGLGCHVPEDDVAR
jgi:hypothetical protein